jgi:hypothetical protein
MKPPKQTRPTVTAALKRAATLKRFRENLAEFGADMKRMHAEKMAKLAEVSATMREAAIVEAVRYCTKALTSRYRHSLDPEDIRSIVALACVEAWESWDASKGAAFNSHAYQRASWALVNECGKGAVSPSQAARRKGVRASVVSLDAPTRGTEGLTLLDALADSTPAIQPTYNRRGRKAS